MDASGLEEPAAALSIEQQHLPLRKVVAVGIGMYGGIQSGAAISTHSGYLEDRPCERRRTLMAPRQA